MKFDKIIDRLRNGEKVRRKSWDIEKKIFQIPTFYGSPIDRQIILNNKLAFSFSDDLHKHNSFINDEPKLLEAAYAIFLRDDILADDWEVVD